MALLKKLTSATLVEVLVATILIVIVFIISSLTINNLLFNAVANNTQVINYRINELQYALQNNQLQLPYTESFENSIITVEEQNLNGRKWVIIKAALSEGKIVSREMYYGEK